MNYALQNGVTVVASNGNGATSFYPANDPRVIAVSQVNEQMERAGGTDPDVVAPGNGVIAPGPVANDDCRTFGGTSAATPHVASLAALMLSVNPTLTPEEIQCAIRENALDLGDTGFDEDFGYGLVDAGKTLRSVATLGDINRDGQVGFLDISPFIVVLSSREYQFEADLNNDGLITILQDLGLFVALVVMSGQ